MTRTLTAAQNRAAYANAQFEAGVRAGLEAAAKLADADAVQSDADSELWEADKMPKLADVSREHAKAARAVADIIRDHIARDAKG